MRSSSSFDRRVRALRSPLAKWFVLAGIVLFLLCAGKLRKTEDPVPPADGFDRTVQPRSGECHRIDYTNEIAASIVHRTSPKLDIASNSLVRAVEDLAVRALACGIRVGLVAASKVPGARERVPHVFILAEYPEDRELCSYLLTAKCPINSPTSFSWQRLTKAESRLYTAP